MSCHSLRLDLGASTQKKRESDNTVLLWMQWTTFALFSVNNLCFPSNWFSFLNSISVYYPCILVKQIPWGPNCQLMSRRSLHLDLRVSTWRKGIRQYCLALNVMNDFHTLFNKHFLFSLRLVFLPSFHFRSISLYLGKVSRYSEVSNNDCCMPFIFETLFQGPC